MKIAPLKRQADAHGDSVWAVAWAPPSAARAHAVLLTGGVDESVKVWQADNDDLQCLRTNAGHVLGVVSVAGSPSGTVAASSSLDCFVRVFDVDSNETIATLESPPAETWQLSFHPQGSLLAVAGGGSHSVKLWRADTWRQAASLDLPSSLEGMGPGGGAWAAGRDGRFVLSCAWSADGRRVACSCMDGTVAVFDVESGRFLHRLKGHFMPVRSLAFSPTDNRVLYTACDDRHIHIYDAEGQAILGAMSGHGGWALCVAPSPDGLCLASGSSDKSVRLWDARMRLNLQVMREHEDQVWGVAFRPLATGAVGTSTGRLASVSDDKSVAIFDYS